MPKQNRSRKKNSSAARNVPAESQAAEAATIGWMLATLTGAVAELGVLAARLYTAAYPDAKGIGTAGELLLFASALIGLIVLGLIPVVYKVRTLKPPPAITAFAVVVGILPWITIIAQAVVQA